MVWASGGGSIHLHCACLHGIADADGGVDIAGEQTSLHSSQQRCQESISTAWDWDTQLLAGTCLWTCIILICILMLANGHPREGKEGEGAGDRHTKRLKVSGKRHARLQSNALNGFEAWTCRLSHVSNHTILQRCHHLAVTPQQTILYQLSSEQLLSSCSVSRLLVALE